MNGTRGLVIATAAAFVVGCSVGLMGGILFVHFVAPRLHGEGVFGPRHVFGLRGFARDGRAGLGALGGPGSPGGHERMFPILERELGLSPEQHRRIVAALDRARERQMATRESVRVWIAHELTPEQRERWEQMEQRFERSRRGLWPHGPMPPDRH